MAKREIREGDTLTVEGKVTRVSDEGDVVTIEVWGQKLTGRIDLIPYTKHQKGNGWPN